MIVKRSRGGLCKSDSKFVLETWLCTFLNDARAHFRFAHLIVNCFLVFYKIQTLPVLSHSKFSFIERDLFKEETPLLFPTFRCLLKSQLIFAVLLLSVSIF